MEFLIVGLGVASILAGANGAVNSARENKGVITLETFFVCATTIALGVGAMFTAALLYT